MRSGPMPKPRPYFAALLLTTCLVGCKQKEEAPQQETPEVEVTEVTQRNVPIYREWVAQLNGRYNAQITPRVQGYLLQQDYRDGFGLHPAGRDDGLVSVAPLLNRCAGDSPIPISIGTESSGAALSVLVLAMARATSRAFS